MVLVILKEHVIQNKWLALIWLPFLINNIRNLKEWIR
jgi:hypothetical protein